MKEKEKDWRVVYYMRPRDLRNVNDNARVLIPTEFHQTLMVQGAILLSDKEIWGSPAGREVINAVLMPFWEAMTGSAESGNGEDYVSQGQMF